MRGKSFNHSLAGMGTDYEQFPGRVFHPGEKRWAQQDLNLRPSDYESPALTAELWAQDA